MEPICRKGQLVVLEEISRIINRSSEMEPMLQEVLVRLLELTGLKAGWIFLTDRVRGPYACVADAGLPPALARDDKAPMTCGTCWCLDRLWEGRLPSAVNILSCKRLDNAVRYDRGDTEGISHHATIPLAAGDELFGLLNVASPGKTHFTAEELAMLQAVAHQIGTAAHRVRLYRNERKRAERLETLLQVAKRLGALQEKKTIAKESAVRIGEGFGWPCVVVFKCGRDGFRPLCGWADGRYAAADEWEIGGLPRAWKAELEDGRSVALRISEDRPFARIAGSAASAAAELRFGAVAPLIVRGGIVGLLAAGGPIPGSFDEVDAAMLDSLGAHVSLAYENAWIYEQSGELARYEERNRIARDLHDSVSQMLFSLSLNARGLERALQEAPAPVRHGVEEVNRLAREALAEMRAMIRQLRPSGLEEGLLAGLYRYGERIGLRVAYAAGEPIALAERVEETLWRIGQEALNNVSKHAGTKDVSLAVACTEWEAVMTIADGGDGFAGGKTPEGEGYGLTTMKERAESVGGSCHVRSVPEQGTEVVVRIPL